MPVVIGDDGEGRALAGADDAEAGRKLCDAVAMAHPYLLAPAYRPLTYGEGTGLYDIHIGAAEFAGVAALDDAAQEMR